MAALPSNLVITCLLMFGGAMLAGSLPMGLQLSSAWLHWTELIGAGFMIGSAFAVILPEGFEVLYAKAEPAQTHATTHATTDSSGLLDASDTHSHRRNLAHEGGHEHVKLPCPRWAPGAALLAGFLAMMLFEYLHHALEGEGAHLPHGHSHTHRHDDHAHLAPGQANALEAGDWTPNSRRADADADCSFAGPKLRASAAAHSDGCKGASAAVHEAEPASRSHSGAPHSLRQSCGTRTTRSVVTALLIHAAADGLAVGVAHMSDSLRLAVTIGMAMVLHKGPVSFGLTSFLLSQRCSLPSVWQDLTMFSAASPVVAVAAYLALRGAVGVSGSSAGVVLSVLFSGGTFLYAACVHLLPAAGSLDAGRFITLAVAAAVPCAFGALGLHHH